MSARRATIGCLALVFAAALGLRLGHLAGLRASWAGTSLFALARGDAAHHWHEALDILDRDFWQTDHVFWKGPGYSYFLAGLMAVFGRSPGALRWPLVVLGALNCAGLVILARRALPLPFATAAGLFAAVNGILILYDGELFHPTLLISLSLPTLWLLARERAGIPAHALAGLLLGLAALVHPAYLTPAAALALASLRRGRWHAAALLLATAATVLPVTLSNWLVRHQPLLISWNGGINLYVGNQPCFDQYSGNRTNAWQRILQGPIDAGLSPEYRRDRLYTALALEQAASAPLPALAILAQKALILLSPVEYASNIGLYELRAHSPVIAVTLGHWGPVWLPFGLWAPPALIGLYLSWRRPDPVTLPLAAYSLGVAVSIILSFNTARYRAPLVFFGAIWIARALEQAWEHGRGRRLTPLALGAGAHLVIFFALSASAVPQRGHPLPVEWNEAAALIARGETEAARPWVERALSRAPEDPALRLAAAGAAHALGEREHERELLLRLLEDDDAEPDLRSTAHYLLARSWAEAERIDLARAEIAEALAVEVDRTEWHGFPYYPLGLGPLTACWLRLEAARFELDRGDPARAAELVERVRRECKAAGRIEDGLIELEARIAVRAP